MKLVWNFNVFWRMRVIGWAFVAVLAAAGGIALGQTTRPAAPGEVARLIGQLGDGEYSVREAASRRLVELGEAARPALQAAMAEGDDEVRQRARSVLFAISELTPQRQAEIAASVAKAYARADYVAAAREQELLARRRRPTVAQCLAVGNHWQLANRWPEAVAGYQRALERVEQVLGGDPETDPPPQPAEEDRKRLGGFGGGGGRGPGMNGIQPMPGLTDFQKRELTQQRAGLILLIGRLQREKLGDGAAAVATLARMVEVVPEFQGDLAGLLPGLAADVALRRAHKEVKHDVGRGLMILNEFDVMEELARTQEKSGQADEAILTLARLCTAYLHTRDDGVDEALANMTRLIEKSPKIAAMAGAGELVKLTPAPVAVAKVAQTTEAFVNAASPFAWTRTNLGDFKLGAVAVRDFARLADGRWIGALAAGGRVYTATSADLVTWDAPVELPHNGVANNTEPAVMVDGKGTIWIAWFNNRLSLNPRSSGGYVLWLTSSGDAKTWSSPRAIGADTGGWPMGALHWLRTADGHYRLSWRAAAATAVSPDEMKALSPIQMFVPQQLWPMDPHVAQDEDGRYHMVLDDRMRGVTYSASRDGRDWSEPVVLVEKAENGPGMEEPAMLLNNGRAALIYQVGSNSFLRRGRWSELKNPEGTVQIGGGGASLLGTRWQRVGGEIVGFAGGETPWIVRGTVAKVIGR
jgi:hypothetical protein